MTTLPSAAIVPFDRGRRAGTGDGAWMIGMNSSTVMIVTMSVCEPLMVGPS